MGEPDTIDKLKMFRGDMRSKVLVDLALVLSNVVSTLLVVGRYVGQGREFMGGVRKEVIQFVKMREVPRDNKVVLGTNEEWEMLVKDFPDVVKELESVLVN